MRPRMLWLRDRGEPRMEPMTNRRVRWKCGIKACPVGEHYGTIIEIPYSDAWKQGLTVDPPGDVLVELDDRPGVLQAHVRSELESA